MTTAATAERPAATSAGVSGVTPYLQMENAREAAALYAKAFGAELVQEMPADDGKRLMHCHLVINGGPLLMSDCFPEYGHPFKPFQGFVVHLQVDDAQAWWDRAVKAGLEVTMPIGQQFWGDVYGQLRDPFGVAWSIGGPPKA